MFHVFRLRSWTKWATQVCIEEICRSRSGNHRRSLRTSISPASLRLGKQAASEKLPPKRLKVVSALPLISEPPRNSAHKQTRTPFLVLKPLTFCKASPSQRSTIEDQPPICDSGWPIITPGSVATPQSSAPGESSSTLPSKAPTSLETLRPI